MEEEQLADEIVAKVIEYAQANYKYLKNKTLIVTEHGKCFHVRDHKDGSPLILGKGILT